MLALLATFSWQELRHHPWRNAAAVLAVMLGVALAFSVHLINASALDEFASAVRSVNGQPDLEVRALQGGFDEHLYARLAARPEVALASPVLEQTALALVGERSVPLRVLGLDALTLPAMAPALRPAPDKDAGRAALFTPGLVFLNPAARKALGDDVRSFTLRADARNAPVRVAGSVAAGGGPLAVMDIGAAQDLLRQDGTLTRIDLRLTPGTDRAGFIRALARAPDWPAQLQFVEPTDNAQRVTNLSRAYRVNLTVLALVALFTGAFLVYSVLALSVAKRLPQFALLGVLGLTPRQRLRLVLVESMLLGAMGSVAGLALGTALAVLALRLLGGDLGGGYFDEIAPALQWHPGAALLYGALGLVAACLGGWWPARAAQRLPEAQALKGLGTLDTGRTHGWLAIVLIAGAAILAGIPAIFGIPLAAYLSVGLLLIGGIAALPWLIDRVYGVLAPALARRLLPMLALERARRMRGTAAVALSGVVASLALAVALTVMVASFRASVTQWLDIVLPAQLYLRSPGGSRGDNAAFTPSFVAQVAQVAGVARVSPSFSRPVQLDAAQPAVTLIGRAFAAADPAATLPLVRTAVRVPAGRIGIYVSEAMVDLHGARVGQDYAPLSKAFEPVTPVDHAGVAIFFVAGVWRDYVRQFGSIVMQAADFERLTGQRNASDLALWLEPGAREGAVQQALRALAERELGSAGLVEFASVAQLRARSLRIFDRSFAVTYWLQAVAIGIGLFGIAASFSAQVLARRKEFGLLAHLGFTRRQILAVVAAEGAAWTAIGTVAGLTLGLAVSLVLVKVVNPQSFHWSMDLLAPWGRLALLCAAVLAAGTATAWLAGRAAAGRDAVQAVREDW